MSFTDSFLDFEAIKNWFENIPNPDMADGEKVDTGVREVDCCLEETVFQEHNVEGSETTVDGSKSVAKVEERECEMLENVSCSIEEDMGKVSLVGESGDLVAVGENGTTKSEITEGNDEKRETASDRDESESSGSESTTTSSSSPSASSSSCNSSDDDDDGDVSVPSVTSSFCVTIQL